jgi:HpiC1 cyclase/PEP-CTERM motif
MKNVLYKVSVLSMAALFTLSAAHAQSITVNNFSFEDDPLYTGSGVNVPSSWTAFNDGNFSGVINSGFTTPLPAPADGNQYFGINEGPSDPTGGIYQDVGTLQANTTYTLTVAIGLRSDFTPGNLGSPGIISLINGSDNTGTLLTSNSGIPTTPGTWLDYDVSYTTGASVSGDLTVQLSVAPASTYQADFDNVRLDATPVPEPSTFALLGGGLALLSLIILRRKQVSVS